MVKLQDLELWSFAGPEAQVAALADDIAYNAHDIDDGLRAALFTLDDLARGRTAARHPARSSHRPSAISIATGLRTSWCAA